jgi:hypothetical protein
MRPKVVIVILVVAFGLLGAMAVLRGLVGKSSGEAGGMVSGSTQTSSSSNGAATAAGGQMAGGTNARPVVSEELRTALVWDEKQKILELQNEADGTNNPTIISALLDKVSSPDAEVRTAALEALKELNDTNAIPGLQKTADSIQDPRGKVAVMDVIDYLNLPGITDNARPEDYTNKPVDPSSIPRNLKMNPQFMPKSGGQQRASSQPGLPQNTPAGQPQ